MIYQVLQLYQIASMDVYLKHLISNEKIRTAEVRPTALRIATEILTELEQDPTPEIQNVLNNILSQAGVSVLAQANQAPNYALRLLDA